jgi:hypothetical protein
VLDAADLIEFIISVSSTSFYIAMTVRDISIELIINQFKIKYEVITRHAYVSGVLNIDNCWSNHMEGRKYRYIRIPGIIDYLESPWKKTIITIVHKYDR